ncbi:hypothetical protein K438DRAFT_1632503 [Mycena galopus ATCC 62051]|nr:hypothetical protein K438DRAFT_1632503 [Mycena galopus ATCC 62051]
MPSTVTIIIGEHFISGSTEQHLMYIAGVGGASKSFVIKTILKKFRSCCASQKMMLNAPTGCADVLIDGFTIHALTF